MRGQRVRVVAANPVLIGASTLLIVVVAVFLAYNANKGLPFLPTFQMQVETPDAARLVVGNEVREGGDLIGQVSKIENVRLKDGTVGASLRLSLLPKAAPIPDDSTILIRPRSTLGLKYVELIRGRSRTELSEGSTLTASEAAATPELDDFFGIFDPPTRANIRRNLATFGGGFAGRGVDLNRTLAALPELLRDIQPVMRTLADDDTQLARFFDELADAARVVAPVSDEFARGFAAMADTFEGFSRDPRALQETIEESPETLRVGIRTLPVQRPFLRRLAGISDELQGTAAEVRASAPPISRALTAGTRVLPRTPRLNEDLRDALAGLAELGSSATTVPVLRSFQQTVGTLDPTLRYVGPHITVCNYWNLWWTFLSDHLSERVETGTIQRIQAKSAPDQDNDLNSFGASQPANAENVNPVAQRTMGDPVNLHAQYYGRAVDERGAADCESGQRGYPERIAEGLDPRFKVAIDPRTPGNQGPTFTGRPRVPEGQTFSAEPTGDAPQVVQGAGR